MDSLVISRLDTLLTLGIFALLAILFIFGNYYTDTKPDRYNNMHKLSTDDYEQFAFGEVKDEPEEHTDKKYSKY